MSEKSFAIGSVAAAVIWGAFFYPPPPPQRAQHSVGPVPAASVSAGRAPRKDGRLAQTGSRPTGTPERRWWRRNPVELRAPGAHP